MQDLNNKDITVEPVQKRRGLIVLGAVLVVCGVAAVILTAAESEETGELSEFDTLTYIPEYDDMEYGGDMPMKPHWRPRHPPKKGNGKPKRNGGSKKKNDNKKGWFGKVVKNGASKKNNGWLPKNGGSKNGSFKKDGKSKKKNGVSKNGGSKNGKSKSTSRNGR